MTWELRIIERNKQNRQPNDPAFSILKSIECLEYYLQSPNRIKGAQKKGWEHSIAMPG
jgi:hypothetical protein